MNTPRKDLHNAAIDYLRSEGLPFTRDNVAFNVRRLRAGLRPTNPNPAPTTDYPYLAGTLQGIAGTIGIDLRSSIRSLDLLESLTDLDHHAVNMARRSIERALALVEEAESF